METTDLKKLQTRFEQNFGCCICLAPKLNMVSGICQHRICDDCLYLDTDRRPCMDKCPMCSMEDSFPKKREEDTSSTVSSSTTSESPQRTRGRGRGRGKGLVVRVRVVAEVQGVEIDDDELIRLRQTSMSEEVATIDVGQLRDVLQQVIQKMRSVMMDIMRPACQHPGHHPSPGSSQPDWCFCCLCREMPTEVKKVCCQKENCISLLPDFSILIMNEADLALAMMRRCDILVFDDESDQRKANYRYWFFIQKQYL